MRMGKANHLVKMPAFLLLLVSVFSPFFFFSLSGFFFPRGFCCFIARSFELEKIVGVVGCVYLLVVTFPFRDLLRKEYSVKWLEIAIESNT